MDQPFITAPVYPPARLLTGIIVNTNGDRFVGSQAILQLVDGGAPTWGTDATARGIEHLAGTVANVQWAPGLRRSRGARTAVRT